MAQTATANLTDFESAAAGATASLDEFQPETLPEVDRAIRSVPRPQLPYMRTEFAPTALANKDVTAGEVFPHNVPLTPEAKAAQAEKGAAFGEDLSQQATAATKELSEHPREAILNVGVPGAGTMARGAEELSTSGKRAEGAIHLASGANDLLAPTIGPAAIENPVSILKGFGEGLAASKGAGYVAKKAGATEKQQEAIEQLAQFAPMTARAFAESLGLSNPKLGLTFTDQGTLTSTS